MSAPFQLHRPGRTKARVYAQVQGAGRQGIDSRELTRRLGLRPTTVTTQLRELELLGAIARARTDSGLLICREGRDGRPLVIWRACAGGEE